MTTRSSGRPRPFVLIIMDGWGINPRKDGNAIAMARTPNLDKLAARWPTTSVLTSGLAVGLPDGQMGNSEVGHQNIGAGKRVLQDYTRVSESIEDGSFFQNPALLQAIKHVKKTLHVCISVACWATGASTPMPLILKHCYAWPRCTRLTRCISIPSLMVATHPRLAAASL